MGEILDYFKNKKNLVSLLILGILILGIPLGVSLVRLQQIIKSRAAVDPITFTGPNVRQKSDGTWVATKPQIQFQLTSPLGPPGTSNTTPSPGQTPTTPPPPGTPITYTDWGGYIYTIGGQKKLVQSFITDDGNTVYTRECNVTASGIDWTGCNGTDKWSPSLLTATGLPATKYIGFGAFNYNLGSQEKIIQGVITGDGKTSYSRECDVTDSGINWAGCNGASHWGSQPLTRSGLPDIKFLSWGGFVYTLGSQKKLMQSFVADDGNTGYYRECDVLSTGINWAGCNGTDKWHTTQLTAAGLPVGRYIGFGAFDYTLGSQEKIIQGVITGDGKTSYSRECNVTTAGIDWTGCNGASHWGSQPLTRSGLPATR